MSCKNFMSRAKDAYKKSVYDFITDIYVVCPKCFKQAIVKTPGYSFKNDFENNVKFICPNCGHSKILREKASIDLRSGSKLPIIYRIYHPATTIDPFFYLPLWLKIDCCNKVLWAYNYEHLDFLKTHITAKLRERNDAEVSNQSIGSRLPRWMTSKKNRDIILRSIQLLQKK